METLLEKIQQLELKNKELEEKLQKYTNSDGHKRYYENIKCFQFQFDKRLLK